MSNRVLFKKYYSDETLPDICSDINDVYSSPAYILLQEDEHRFKRGTFTITVEWTDE